MSSRFQLGAEYNALAPGEKITPVGNVFLQTESDTRAAIVAGFSSDRIGTPTGMSTFISLQKQLGGPSGIFSPYVGLSYSGYGREWLVPAGVSISLRSDIVLLPMVDGRYAHTTVTWFGRSGQGYSVLFAFNRRLGFTYSRNF